MISITLTLNFLILLFVLLVLLTNLNTFACPSKDRYFLEVIHRNNRESLLSIEVYPEVYFYLEYTNSRDLNPIIDILQVGEEGYFYLLEERYPWYGVGQEYHSSKNISYDGRWVVVKVNQKLKKLPLRVAYTVEQILRVKNQKYLLNRLAEGGEALDILITVKGGQERSE